MSNQESLQRNILRELQKTGYPTEIVSASIMQQRGWTVIHNPSYRDDREGIGREFDIRAYRSWSFDTAGGEFAVGVYLITECKKSEKPWVFFATPEKHEYSRLGELIKGRVAGKRVFTSRNHADSLMSDDELRALHHYFQKQSLAHTFYEPFKGQEKADTSPMIYSAVMSSIKATLFHYQDRPIENWLRIYYPVIIFDGNLFEAHIAPNKTIDLVISDHIQLSFNYMLPSQSSHRSIWEGQQRFIVDVVRESYLDQFLEAIEDEHAVLIKHLQEALGDTTGSA